MDLSALKRKAPPKAVSLPPAMALNRPIVEGPNDAVRELIEAAKLQQAKLRRESQSIDLEVRRLDKFIEALNVAHGVLPGKTTDEDLDSDYPEEEA